MLEQRRLKSKINIQKPRKPHYLRGVFEQFVTPYYEPRPVLPVHDLCSNIEDARRKKNATADVNPYEIIIGREVLNWFNNSRMIAFLHKNSISAEDEFDFAVQLRRENMFMKFYGIKIMEAGLKGTKYENVLELWGAPGKIIFCDESKVPQLLKIMKRTPQLVLMGKLINKYLKMRETFFVICPDKN